MFRDMEGKMKESVSEIEDRVKLPEIRQRKIKN